MADILNNNHFNKEGSNPFITPENYFEELPERIIKRCNSVPKKNNKVFLFNKPVLNYAATVLVLIGATFITLYFSNRSKKDFSENQTQPFSDSILYIANLHEVDEPSMIDYLAEQNLNDNSSKLNNDDIIQYIDNNTNNDNEVLELIN